MNRLIGHLRPGNATELLDAELKLRKRCEQPFLPCALELALAYNLPFEDNLRAKGSSQGVTISWGADELNTHIAVSECKQHELNAILHKAGPDHDRGLKRVLEEDRLLKLEALLEPIKARTEKFFCDHNWGESGNLVKAQLHRFCVLPEQVLVTMLVRNDERGERGKRGDLFKGRVEGLLELARKERESYRAPSHSVLVDGLFPCQKNDKFRVVQSGALERDPKLKQYRHAPRTSFNDSEE